MKDTDPSAPNNTGAPANAQRVLATLVIVAAVANLPLAMANVALPSIGKYFNASQIELNRQDILSNAYLQDYVKTNPISDDVLKADYDKIKSRLLPVTQRKADSPFKERRE